MSSIRNFAQGSSIKRSKVKRTTKRKYMNGGNNKDGIIYEHRRKEYNNRTGVKE